MSGTERYISIPGGRPDGALAPAAGDVSYQRVEREPTTDRVEMAAAVKEAAHELETPVDEATDVETASMAGRRTAICGSQSRA